MKSMSVEPGNTTANSLQVAIRNSIKQQYMRIDKLSLLSGYGTSTQNRERLKVRLDALKGDDLYRVRRVRGSKLKEYKSTVVVREVNDKKRYWLISYCPVESGKKRKHFVRIEFSPQHFDDEGLKKMLDWLSHNDCLGKMMRRVIEKSIVSRVDVAFDVFGIEPGDFCLSLLKRFTGSVTYGSDGRVVTWIAGSRRSDTFLTSYKKSILVDVGMQGMPSDSKEVVATRFEFRISDGIPLLSIEALENPFKEMKLYPRELMNDPEIFPWFKLLLQHVPMDVAFHAIDDINLRDKLKRRVDKYMVPFDADELWEMWPDCIKKLNAIVSQITDRSHFSQMAG